MTLDLALVVPDKSIEQAFHGLLSRPHALGIRSIRYSIQVHPNRDPGCYKSGDQLALTSRFGAKHALIVFDFAWEGRPSEDPADLERDIETRLQPVWGARGRCIVIAPELEIWVWGDSPHVDAVLGWAGRQPPLRSWLASEGLWPLGAAKPADPKEAFLRAVRFVKVPPSASLFKQLAERVSLTGCADPCFGRLLALLQEWFPPGTGAEG